MLCLLLHVADHLVEDLLGLFVELVGLAELVRLLFIHLYHRFLELACQTLQSIVRGLALTK